MLEGMNDGYINRYLRLRAMPRLSLLSLSLGCGGASSRHVAKRQTLLYVPSRGCLLSILTSRYLLSLTIISHQADG